MAPVSFGNRGSLIGWGFEPELGIYAAAWSKLGLDIRSMREPLKRSIQQVMAPSIGMNFIQQGRPETWRPLTQQTLDNKSTYGYPENILQRTGLLMKTMQQLNIWTISRTQATIAALPDAVAYGAFHQNGTRWMPARPFAMIQPEDEDKIQEIFADWMVERVMKYVGWGAL